MIRGAVLGSPVSHSLSPRLHKSACEFLGVEIEYQPIDVPAGSLAQFFVDNSKDFDYFSLTMPLKEEVLALPVNKDKLVSRIQSANTLVKKGAEWTLTSTDGSGFLAALAHVGLHSFDRVLILGAGGTARAVAGALDLISTEIDVLARSSLRAPALESAVTKANFQYIRWKLDVDFHSYDLVVNTTPAGAADLLAECVQSKLNSVLFDVIYKPWPTVLATAWNNVGSQVMNGLELLIYQGIDQLELLLTREIDREALASHLRSTLRD